MSKLTFDSINEKVHSIANKKVTLGFDGFIDVIYRVIKSKDDQSAIAFFDTSQELGEYIIKKGEKNFSLELEAMTTKIGGNMPIMANALAPFGPQQYCIGAIGYPTVHPLFSEMPSNCRLFSFAEPGLAKALEFLGNKIMLAEIGELNTIEWGTIKNIIGLQTMIDLFSECDLICILNWSELDNSTAWWKGLQEDILPRVPVSAYKPISLFDLADCSKRTPESILEAMYLLRSFSEYWDIVLSLNLNEAIIVNNALTGMDHAKDSIEKIGGNLYEKLGISNVVIHNSRNAFSWDSSGVQRVESFHISNPVISTGAGDNFNAGYCAGLLMGLNAEASLVLGHAVTNLYMSSGKSPSIPDLLRLLADKLQETTSVNTKHEHSGF
jgi:hypothetical protein